MIELKVEKGLLFCGILVKYDGKELNLSNVLVDTGSGGIIFKTDVVEKIGIVMEPNDPIEVIRGVGGSEFVFIKELEAIEIDGITISDFQAEIGAMNYGIEMEGIIGLDLLMRLGVKIDLESLQIYK